MTHHWHCSAEIASSGSFRVIQIRKAKLGFPSEPVSVSCSFSSWLAASEWLARRVRQIWRLVDGNGVFQGAPG